MRKSLEIVLLVIVVFLSKIPSQAQITKEIDSLEQLIALSNNDSLKMQWYNQLRRMTYYSDIDQSIRYNLEFLELAQKNNLPDQIAFGHFYIANGYFEKSDYPKALEYYMKAGAYFEENNDSIRLASVFNGIGAAYEKSGNDSISLNYYLMSYTISDKLKDDRRSALALNNIANIHKIRGDIEQSIFYLEQAVGRLPENEPQYLNPMKANLASSYNDHGQTEMAEKIYQDILASIHPNQDAFTYINVLKGLGKIALEKEQFSLAVELLEESYLIATEKNFFEQRFDVMKNLIDAYSYEKKYKEALDLFYEYQTIKDSIFTFEKDKNLSEAIQKYEAEKKDLIIAQQKFNVEKQERIKGMYLAGAVLFALFSIMIYVFFRKRLKYHKAIAERDQLLQQQKITELKQEQKLITMNSMMAGQEAERKRIAKDLHDGLGSLLSSVKAHFSGLKNVSEVERQKIYDKTDSLIDEACVSVRRISHNMMPHALSLSGLENALADLGESLSQEGIQTSVEINQLPVKIDDSKAVMIYRLAQELVTNIRKHAQAKNVLLQLITSDKSILLTVEDDGKGFEPNVEKESGGLGLKSVLSRVEFLKGTIDIDSKPKQGTTVTVEIPLL